MNSIYPLFNALSDCYRSIKHIINKLPNYVDYPIDNKLYYGDIYISIGIATSGDVKLKIGGEQSHTYIVGNTGSGKSNLIRVITSTLINNYPNVSLVLYDYKRCELSLFANVNNCIDFQWDSEAITNGINNLYQEVLNRYDYLASKGLIQAEYTLKPIVCIIEEISLMDKQTMKILKKLMSISRAVKVYCIITLQRVSNDNLDNTIKSLVSNRLVLKVEDKKNSMIALDTEGAELLKGNGNGIYKTNGKMIEFQGYYISDEQVAEIVSKHSNNQRKILFAKTDNNKKAGLNFKPVYKTTNTNINGEWWDNI